MDRVRDAVLAPQSAGSLYRWLRQNHDEFADIIAQTGRRPDWAAITKALHEEKLRDAAGGVPTAERVRITWFKVRQDVAKDRAKKGQAVKSSAAISAHVRKDVVANPVTSAKPSKAPESDADRKMEEFRKIIRNAGYGAKDD